MDMVTFTLLGLEFAILLGLFVGLSVLIPYIGAIFMGLPVALVAYFQWGWGHEFAYVVAAYTLIQLIDGNILATLLFSEVVNLHPIAIIVSILVFGGIWGFWGLFFAIPLATLVQAILRAWPKREVGRQGREPEAARQKENSGEASPGGVEEEKIQRDIHAHG
jgi:putative permease